LNFDQLGLIEPLLQALKGEGYTTPTPVQQQCIPHVLQGRDVLGCAQTGTGKTAAFALPILQLLQTTNQNGRGYKHIRALVLTPTRELAVQIDESFAAYGCHTAITGQVIYGGVSQHTQTQALRNGTDVLVATPGRLLDLMNQGYVHLDHLEILVLDEADRMLDMGFIHDVKRIIRALPQERQTLFFSATMPPPIAQLADSLLYKPAKVEVTPVSSTVELISQSVYFVGKRAKKDLLTHLLHTNGIGRALVFTRTKHGADRLVKDLKSANVNAAAIHGDKSQQARQYALQQFKGGRLKILVATDIAARGIDIDDLTHVINYDVPNIPETYVHRIGRTGRAGAAGTAISFCDGEERAFLKDIQKLTAQHIPVVEEHPFKMSAAEAGPRTYAPQSRPARRPSGNGFGHQKHWNRPAHARA
jgi:ATP-dependent RNA helicase RhlE